MEYNTSAKVGRFNLKATRNSNSSNTVFESSASSVGAFSKILKLPPINSTEEYLILV